MTAAMPTLDLPANPSARSAWLSFQLKVRGLSISALARRHDVSSQALGAVMTKPSARLERIVAEVLGLKPRQLFPERYDRRGRRLIRTRERYAARNHASEA